MDLSEVERFEIAQKYPKVSEAMRKGLARFPKKASAEFYGKDDESACALGAIFYGFGYRSLDKMPEDLAKHIADAQDAYRLRHRCFMDEHNDLGVSRERILERLEELGL